MSSDVRNNLPEAWLLVVKVGSSLLTGSDGLNHANLRRLCEQISVLHDQGRSIVIVSSGAIAEGCHRLGYSERPKTMYDLQAAAAVGQIGLVAEYERNLQQSDIHTALVLLTHDDLKDRLRYLNARQTIQTLINSRVIPVINENDSVSTQELQFGDNDTLAARVAGLIQADLFVILTDQEGLLERDPNIDPNASLVSERSAFDSELKTMAGGSSSSQGRGGMISKLEAARFAANSGCHTVIASGVTSNVLLNVLAGESVGTLLTARIQPVVARKQWIAGQLNVAGTVTVDDGAAHALQRNGVSLLAVGVTGVDGKFSRGDLIRIVSEDGVPIAQGLSNYNSMEVDAIKGCSSNAIEGKLGYMNELEIVHRDNLAVHVH